MANDRELVFGTTNPAKLKQIQDILKPAGIILLGLNEFELSIEVAEDGATAQANARIKALTYANTIGRTVLAMDNALNFDDLPDAEQPGTHVRRIDGKEPANDGEMLASYIELIGKHGGQLKGRWEYAFSIAQPGGKSVEKSIYSPRLFMAKPSKKTVPGYPLLSIQMVPSSDKYISEMSEQEQAKYWQDSIGQPLVEFVTSNL